MGLKTQDLHDILQETSMARKNLLQTFDLSMKRQTQKS